MLTKEEIVVILADCSAYLEVLSERAAYFGQGDFARAASDQGDALDQVAETCLILWAEEISAEALDKATRAAQARRESPSGGKATN